MKILFCQHNVTIKERDKLVHRPTIDLPLGILYMASYLRGKDWPGEIEIYDARLSGLVNKLPNGDMVFGDLDDVIEKNIKDSNPDIIEICIIQPRLKGINTWYGINVSHLCVTTFRY